MPPEDAMLREQLSQRRNQNRLWEEADSEVCVHIVRSKLGPAASDKLGSFTYLSPYADVYWEVRGEPKLALGRSATAWMAGGKPTWDFECAAQPYVRLEGNSDAMVPMGSTVGARYRLTVSVLHEGLAGGSTFLGSASISVDDLISAEVRKRGTGESPSHELPLRDENRQAVGTVTVRACLRAVKAASSRARAVPALQITRPGAVDAKGSGAVGAGSPASSGGGTPKVAGGGQMGKAQSLGGKGVQRHEAPSPRPAGPVSPTAAAAAKAQTSPPAKGEAQSSTSVKAEWTRGLAAAAAAAKASGGGVESARSSKSSLDDSSVSDDSDAERNASPMMNLVSNIWNMYGDNGGKKNGNSSSTRRPSSDSDLDDDDEESTAAVDARTGKMLPNWLSMADRVAIKAKKFPTSQAGGVGVFSTAKERFFAITNADSNDSEAVLFSWFTDEATHVSGKPPQGSIRLVDVLSADVKGAENGMPAGVTVDITFAGAQAASSHLVIVFESPAQARSWTANFTELVKLIQSTGP